MLNENKNEPPPSAVLFQIISGFWVSRAVYIIAKLGIPDLLRDGARTVEELASATETHAPSLFRVLRALVSVGVLTSDEGGFGLTPISELLVTDAKGSVRWFTVSELGEEHYPAWGNLMHSVKTGEIAFDNLFGMDVWAYLHKNPDAAVVFNDSMSSLTTATNEAITSVYDFSGFRKVVDIGGGHGALITSILKRNPEATGVLFDSPEVVSGARSKIQAAGLAERCEVAEGNFFQAVPAGGDAYILKWIIHDWNDEQSIAILKNIRKQIPANGKLILVDSVVPDTPEPHFSKFIDLNMLVMTGGKERTASEFKTLLAAAGFRLVRVVSTDVPTDLIEAEPV